MEITRGMIPAPQRIVMYGPESIGKSTLASKLPNPVFIDVEDSTEDLDVARTPKPGSWRALLDTTASFAANHLGFSSLVIDSADWAEKLCIAHVLATNNLTALGGNDDFGRSWNLMETEWCRYLDLLTRVANSGMHVCLTAHAKMRTFNVPDQDVGYDRWELKMERKTSSATKEWCRTLLFLNYKTYVVKGQSKMDKAKAKGGKRVMFTSHHPCWDAKNRAGLDEEMDLDFAKISHLFAFDQSPQQPQVQAVASPPEQTPQVANKQSTAAPAPTSQPFFLHPLLELLQRDNINEHELQLAVAKRGYYPADTPLANYDPQFVAGKLVAFWPQVREMINQVRQEAATV